MENTDRKVYEQPAVVYEADLEVRAGSPLGVIKSAETDLFGE